MATVIEFESADSERLRDLAEWLDEHWRDGDSGVVAIVGDLRRMADTVASIRDSGLPPKLPEWRRA